MFRTTVGACAALLALTFHAGTAWAQFQYRVPLAGLQVKAPSGTPAPGGSSTARAVFTSANAALDFGTAELGAVAPSAVWSFTNEGGAPMSLQLSGLPDGITLDNQCVQVPAGAGCSMTLSLQTQTVRIVDPTPITVTGAAAASLQQNFSVRGTVVAAIVREALLTSGNAAMNLGWFAVGDPQTPQQWVFQNRGNVPMTLTLAGLPAGVTQQNECTNIASYESCTIRLALDTSAERTVAKTSVTLSGDWAGALSEALSVEGGVAPTGFRKVSAPVNGLSFSSLTFNQGQFYSVMYGTNPTLGTGSFLFTSSDGQTWTNKGRIQTDAQPSSGVAFGTGGRILVSGLSSGSTGGKVMTSDNAGATWTQRLSTGGLGKGIAVNDAGIAVFTTVNIPQGYRSTNNGTSWATNAVNDNSSGSKIVSNGGAQFATLSSASIRYSLDSGVSWTQVFAGGGYLYDLTFIGNQVWAVGAGGGTPGRVCSLTLGSAPACSLISGSPTLTSLTYGKGTLVVGTSTANVAYKSTDGSSWATISGLPAWSELAFGNGLFVAVRGQDAYVAVSP